MEKSTKISIWQLFSIVLLSRLLTLLTYTPVGAESLKHTSDYFPAVGFAVLFILLFSLPLVWQRKAFPNHDLVDIAYYASPLLSKGTSLCLAFFFAFNVLTTLGKLEWFVGTIIFPENSSSLFVLICVAAACYAASLGLEAVGRASGISLVVFCASFIFIMFAMSDKIDFLNFSPVFYDGVQPSLKAGLDAATRTVEIAVLSVLMPRASGNPGKMYTAFITSLGGWMLLVFFFVTGGLGDFVFSQLFPIHAMAELSQFSVFQRFDVLLTGVWILTAFIKISLLLYLQAMLLQKSFVPKWKNIYILVAGAVVFLVQILFGGVFSEFFFGTSLLERLIFFVLFVVVLPLAVLTAATLKRKRAHE